MFSEVSIGGAWSVSSKTCFKNLKKTLYINMETLTWGTNKLGTFLKTGTFFLKRLWKRFLLYIKSTRQNRNRWEGDSSMLDPDICPLTAEISSRTTVASKDWIETWDLYRKCIQLTNSNNNDNNNNNNVLTLFLLMNKNRPKFDCNQMQKKLQIISYSAHVLTIYVAQNSRHLRRAIIYV